MHRFVKYCFFLVILLAPPGVQARHSYSQVSDDGKFLFVMLAPVVQANGESCCTDSQTEERRLRETYPSSGMYPNNGLRTPLWTVDWWADEVVVPSGGEHVVRFEAGKLEMTSAALTFLRRNEVIRSYTLDELTERKQLIPAPAEGFIWVKEKWLKKKHSHLVIVTIGLGRKNQYGYRYDFDYTTGEIVKNGRTWDRVGWTIFIVISVGCLLFLSSPWWFPFKLFRTLRSTEKRRRRRSAQREVYADLEKELKFYKETKSPELIDLKIKTSFFHSFGGPIGLIAISAFTLPAIGFFWTSGSYKVFLVFGSIVLLFYTEFFSHKVTIANGFLTVEKYFLSKWTIPLAEIESTERAADDSVNLYLIAAPKAKWKKIGINTKCFRWQDNQRLNAVLRNVTGKSV